MCIERVGGGGNNKVIALEGNIALIERVDRVEKVYVHGEDVVCSEA